VSATTSSLDGSALTIGRISSNVDLSNVTSITGKTGVKWCDTGQLQVLQRRCSSVFGCPTSICRELWRQPSYHNVYPAKRRRSYQSQQCNVRQWFHGK
jgi:predicted RNase H-like nuclease